MKPSEFTEELRILAEVVEIGRRRMAGQKEEQPGADLLRLAEILTDRSIPAYPRQIAATLWKHYRKGPDTTRAMLNFGLVKFTRLLKSAAAASLEPENPETVPAGFRM